MRKQSPQQTLLAGLWCGLLTIVTMAILSGGLGVTEWTAGFVGLALGAFTIAGLTLLVQRHQR